MRFLGIDFGERRIGVAVSDTGARVATPLTTVHRRNDAQAIDELLAILDEEEIESIVVGEPRRADGSRGDAAERASRFAAKLADSSGRQVFLIDENLTTHAARELAGTRLRRREQLDALAAQLLLQEAIDNPEARYPLERDRPDP